jgi:hypothetical protein
MASLLTNQNITTLTGVLADHFDTFARTITIHKEPLKVVSSINSNDSYAGYGESSNRVNFTYVPQSQSFQAIVIYKNEQSNEVTQFGSFPEGVIKIKVKKDARDYILNGKTEKINVDGKSFNTVTEDKVQNYLGLEFYIFYLKQTS